MTGILGRLMGIKKKERSAHMVRRWEGHFNWAKARKACKGLNKMSKNKRKTE
jgi:hypothetical protein